MPRLAIRRRGVWCPSERVSEEEEEEETQEFAAPARSSCSSLVLAPHRPSLWTMHRTRKHGAARGRQFLLLMPRPVEVAASGRCLPKCLGQLLTCPSKLDGSCSARPVFCQTVPPPPPTHVASFVPDGHVTQGPSRGSVVAGQGTLGGAATADAAAATHYRRTILGWLPYRRACSKTNAGLRVTNARHASRSPNVCSRAAPQRPVLGEKAATGLAVLCVSQIPAPGLLCAEALFFLIFLRGAATQFLFVSSLSDGCMPHLLMRDSSLLSIPLNSVAVRAFFVCRDL